MVSKQAAARRPCPGRRAGPDRVSSGVQSSVSTLLPMRQDSFPGRRQHRAPQCDSQDSVGGTVMDPGWVGPAQGQAWPRQGAYGCFPLSPPRADFIPLSPARPVHRPRGPSDAERSSAFPQRHVCQRGGARLSPGSGAEINTGSDVSVLYAPPELCLRPQSRQETRLRFDTN